MYHVVNDYLLSRVTNPVVHFVLKGCWDSVCFIVSLTTEEWIDSRWGQKFLHFSALFMLALKPT